MRVTTRGVSSETSAFAGFVDTMPGTTALATPAAAAWIACRRERSTEKAEALGAERARRVIARVARPIVVQSVGVFSCKYKSPNVAQVVKGLSKRRSDDDS